MNPPRIELDQAQIQGFLQRVEPMIEPTDFDLLKTLSLLQKSAEGSKSV